MELDKRGAPHGVRAFSVHPGGIITGLAKFMTDEERARSPHFGPDGQPVIDPERNMKTVEQGAATSIWCATSAQLDGMGGVYCENCDISPATTADSDDLLGVRPWATDPIAAARLWDLSEERTGAAI